MKSDQTKLFFQKFRLFSSIPLNSTLDYFHHKTHIMSTWTFLYSPRTHLTSNRIIPLSFLYAPISLHHMPWTGSSILLSFLFRSTWCFSHSYSNWNSVKNGMSAGIFSPFVVVGGLKTFPYAAWKWMCRSEEEKNLNKNHVFQRRKKIIKNWLFESFT